MSFDIVAVVLLAALLHALWNALIKQGQDRFLSISLMSLFMGLIAVFMVPFVAVPSGVTWVWILASAALHTGYKIFLIKAYNAGDLSQIYPLARGSAPLLSSLLSVVFIHEYLSPGMSIGIAVLCAGILVMSWRGGANAAKLDGRALAWALGTSGFIASYTVVDGIGARGAGTVASYAVWMFLIDGLWMALFCVMVRGTSVLQAAAGKWTTGLATGIMSLAAYGLVLWAMTKAPIGAVAALRETSILFAIVIGWLVLGEKLTLPRLLAATLIIAGVILMRFGS